MRRRLWSMLCACLLLAATPAQACELAIGRATRADGRWSYDLDLRTRGWLLAGVEAVEKNEDVVLELELGGRRAASDVAPSRYAIERSSVILAGPAHGRLTVRAFDVAVKRPPQLRALCATTAQPEFLPLALWQGLVELVQHADAQQPAGGRAAARARAIDYADAFAALARLRGFAPEFAAGALHVHGYLASNAGRHADARTAYADAAAAWKQAALPAPAAAAQFQVAAEELALGRAGDALVTLQPLLTAAAREQYQPVWVWASNDRCVALRNLDRRDEAARCFAELVRTFDAAHEPKEAANALCNEGSALGASGRWREAAPKLAGCRARRYALGFASGISHAELLLGWQALETDSVETAITHFGQSAAAAERSGETSRIWDARRWLAQAWMDADELPKARAALGALQSDEAQESSRNAQWHVAMAQLELLSDDRAAAAAHLQRAARRFARIGQATALADTHCLQALVEPAADVTGNCDALTAAQALLARGQTAAARERLAPALPAHDRDLLRRFLLAASAPSPSERQALQQLVDEAAALPRTAPRPRSQRGQLLARQAYELAQLADSGHDAALAWLALDALWQAGGSPAGFGRRLYGQTSAMSPEKSAPLPQRPSLQPGSVLVASTSFLGKGYLLIARADGIAVVAVDMPEIARTTLAWREQLDAGRAPPQTAQAVAVATGLPRWWRDDDRRVLLALHGPLSTLPWSALPIAGNAPPGMNYRPLVDQATIEYVADVAAAAPRTLAPAIRFFPTATDSSLPGTRVERQRISALAQQAGWSAGTGPTPAGGVLHIAVHAAADDVSADGNRLLLPDGRGATLPFPDELAGSAGLVVLAGCETGAGPSSRWSLPSSLASHAIAAGSPAVLAHLWPVADAAGSRLHANFYAALLHGREPAAALRDAQLAQMQSAQQHEPRYWASAVLLISRGVPDSSSAGTVASGGCCEKPGLRVTQ